MKGPLNLNTTISALEGPRRVYATSVEQCQHEIARTPTILFRNPLFVVQARSSPSKPIEPLPTRPASAVYDPDYALASGLLA